MAKGPLVTPEVEALIASVYQRHSKWKAPVVRNEVSYILRKNNPKLPPGWPSLSKVQKVLATIRNPQPDVSQEKYWSMATLDDYPIPPGAIAAVLKVWKFRKRKKQDLTIREAKWAARLSALETDIGELSARAGSYAYIEWLYQLIDRPFDSTMLDHGLMGIPLVATFEGLFLEPSRPRQKEQPYYEYETCKYVPKEKAIAGAKRIRKNMLILQTKLEDYKKEAQNERQHP